MGSEHAYTCYEVLVHILPFKPLSSNLIIDPKRKKVKTTVIGYLDSIEKAQKDLSMHVLCTMAVLVHIWPFKP